MRVNKQHVGYAMAAITMLGFCSSGGPLAQAREQDNHSRTSEALIGTGTTYRALAPYRVCADGENVIVPAPDGKTALIQHQRTEPPPGQASLERDTEKNGGQTTAQLLLLSPGGDRAPVVWRGGGNRTDGYAAPVSIEWLPGTQIAVVQVLSLPGPVPTAGSTPKDLQPRTSLLLVQGDTGITRTIAPANASVAYLMVSRDKPLAVLVDSRAGTVQRLEKDTLGPLIPIKTLKNRDALIWYNILPDNRTIVGANLEVDKEGSRGPRTFYQVDTITGKATVVQKTEGLGSLPRASDRPPVAILQPFVVVRGKETVTRGGMTTEVHPLWLEGRNKETVGRVLLAPDSDEESEPVVLESAVLYKHKKAVYAVPIRKTSAP